MTLAELVDSCNRAGIRLGVDGDRLRVDAVKGTLTPAIRDALVAYRPVLIDALASTAMDAEREATPWADHLGNDEGQALLEQALAEPVEMAHADPLGYADVTFESVMEDWLWLVMTMDDDAIIIGTDGRQQGVYHTARQLLHGIGPPVANRWEAILHLYNATLKARPDYPTARDAFEFYRGKASQGPEVHGIGDHQP